MNLYQFVMFGLIVLSIGLLIRLTQPKWLEWRDWPVVYRGFCCRKCGSWRNHAEPFVHTDWGTDVGEILQIDPAKWSATRRICDECQNVMFEGKRGQNHDSDGNVFLKARARPFLSEEGIAPTKEEVLNHDFKKDR